MEKELAKQLRDAGFPEQTEIAYRLNLRRYRSMDEEAVSYPFLQELIAEVDRLAPVDWLLKPNEFSAEAEFDAIEGSAEGFWKEHENGKTPEEAMSKLWLKLKAKSTPLQDTKQ